jgi:hypothetical protein
MVDDAFNTELVVQLVPEGSKTTSLESLKIFGKGCKKLP